eukprot:CAMPEP_0117423056 /NCGR_PEP_ID=MMETSP0758-20121206/3771_1 /TAXON_ID=63605 /ORGANISM="Percolomonas cosmopolitus, Strain AE-1 (ATCC 50343)" /LENGTH=1206 /DNA_ID=CAMNT_0005206045 /DNA_START=151 /DNA_END=3771 /DNA_ORIENTATION=-
MKDISEEYKKEDFSHVVKAAKVIYKQHDVDDVLADLDTNIRKMKECVTQIVDVNYEGFHESIKNFSKILMNIQHSQEKISKLEEDINQTESLLKSRADNLPELYQRYLQHSEFLRILSKIQKVKNSVKEIDHAQSTNHFLAATQMILSTEELLSSSELNEIAALAGIKDNLKAHRQLMPKKLFEIVQKKYLFTGNDEKRQHDKRIHNEAFNDPVSKMSGIFGNNDSRSKAAAIRMRRMSRITPQQMASHTMDVSSNPLINNRRRRGGSRRSQLTHEQLLDQEKKMQELEKDDLTLDYMNKNPPLFVSHCVKAIYLLDQTREAEFAFVQSLQKNINTLITEHCQESVVKYMKSERYFNLQRTLQSLKDRDVSVGNRIEMSDFKRSTIEKYLFTDMMKGLNEKIISILNNSKDVLHNLKYKEKYKHHKQILTKDMILRFRTALIMDEQNLWRFKESELVTDSNPSLQNLYQSTILQMRYTLDTENNTLVEPGVTTIAQLRESFQIIANDLSQNSTKNSSDVLTNVFTEFIRYVFDPSQLGERFKLDLNYIWKIIQNELVFLFTNIFDVKVNEEDEKQKAKNAKEKAAELAKAPVLKFSLADYYDLENEEKEKTENEKKAKKANDMEILRNQLTGVFDNIIKKTIYNYIWIHKHLEEIINECTSLVESEDESTHVLKNYLVDVFQPHLIKCAEAQNRRMVDIQFHSEEWHQPNANNCRVMNIASIVLVEFKSLMMIRDQVPPLSTNILETIMTLFENVYDRITSRFSKECQGTGVSQFMKGFKGPKALNLTVIFANMHSIEKNDLVEAFEKREINLDSPHFKVIDSSTSLIFISILSTTFRYIVDQLLDYASKCIINNGVSSANKRRSMSQEEYNVKKHQLLEHRRKSNVVLSIGKNDVDDDEEDKISEEIKTKDSDYVERHDHKFQKKFEEAGLKELYEIVQKYRFVSKHARACLRLNFRLHFISSIVPSLKSSDYSRKTSSLKQRLEESKANKSSSFADSFITRYTLDLRRMWNCVELYINKDELHLLVKDFEFLIRYVFITVLRHIKDKRFSHFGIERMKRNLYALQQSYSALVHQTNSKIDFQAFTDITNYYDLLCLQTKELFAYLKHQIDECSHKKEKLPYEPEEFATILKTIGPNRPTIDPVDQKKLNTYLKAYNPHPEKRFVHATATPEVDVDSNIPDPSEMSAMVDFDAGTMTEDYKRVLK